MTSRDFAKQLRRNMTDAEQRLWYYLRAHRLQGFKFKRQQPIGIYIVDFVCLDARLVIEIDGGQHGESQSDQVRDTWLRNQGFRIIRFWNNDVLQLTNTVLQAIVDALNPSPNPLPQGEREKNMNQNKTPRILVIRRDNIGDLVCTTPLIRALRARFPNAWIGALVNSYNAPVLNGNPDLDGVFVYTKAKHRSDESLIGILWRRWQMVRKLRAMQLDDVIIATTSAQPRVIKLARWLQPKRVIGFDTSGADINLPLASSSLHEVEDVFRAGSLYGIGDKPPATFVHAKAKPDQSTIAIHISARKPSQRWPTERFVELMQTLHASDGSLRFLLLWSPGANDDPRHPGDDMKAAQIIAALGAAFPIVPMTTPTLEALISALSKCTAMICADGGAMHLGAGLGLPIVAMFGDSSVQRWRPWAVPQQVLQAPSRNVGDISVAEVVAAFSELRESTQAPTA
jgi:very-short-patch-repair endonuclease/ADP-heptose:LPS heptosyltransferase